MGFIIGRTIGEMVSIIIIVEVVNVGQDLAFNAIINVLNVLNLGIAQG